MGRSFTLKALPLLAVMLLMAAPSVLDAEQPATDAAPLEDLIRAGGTKQARFVLTDGRMVIGRIIRIDDESILIRRPSAGLLTLPLTDIAGVKVKAPDGEFLLGRLTRMAEGGVGWLAEVDQLPDIEVVDVETNPSADTGGPLIRLDKTLDGQKGLSPSEQGEGEDGETETPDVKLAAIEATDDAAPDAGTAAADAASITLTVTTEKTSESDQLMYFRLTLSEPATQSILVIYTMLNGTAVAPGDYTHRQGVVVFKPGQTHAVVATSLVNDEASEGEESFIFFVTADPSAVTIDNRKIEAVIADDDS